MELSVPRLSSWLRMVFGPLAPIVVLLVLGAAPVFAAGRLPGGARNRGGGGTSATGDDISYPQCGSSFPTDQAFGIVGLNGGLANTLNACLGPSNSYPSYMQSELYWAAATSSGTSTQPKASLYVNTGDPGNIYNGVPVADWPSSGSTPYGSCTTTAVTTSSGTFTVGANSNACAWEYGSERATQDITWLTDAANAIDGQSPPTTVPSATNAYGWWLDVETANSWQAGAAGQAMNVADLQGMVVALQRAGVAGIGIYSTSSAWTQVTGGTSSASGALYGLPDWIPGARTLSQAQANCGQTSFSGGTVALTQWFGRPFDGDYVCSAGAQTPPSTAVPPARDTSGPLLPFRRSPGTRGWGPS